MSARGERRRQERAARKGRLCVADAYRLNQNRRLPKEHPSFGKGEPRMTSASVAWRFLDIIKNSGVVPDLERRLRTQPGQKSKLSIKALLLLYLLAAYKGDSARRTDLCSVGNGLDSQVAFFLGLCDSDRWDPLSYVVTRKQSKRFEGALHEGWAAEDGTPRNFTWLVRKLLAASVPNRSLKTIAAVAIDSSADPTWARTRKYQLEKDLLAEHRLESLETPDLAEPDIKPNKNPKGKIGTLGPDGRFIRSYDIDARPGYRSATNKEPASLFLGYDAHIAVAVAEAVWSGNPNQVAIKPAPPGYILALHVAAGATNPGPIGLELALQSLEIAPNIGDVVVDRAYSNKRQSFVRPLHQMGKNVTMDYTTTEINNPKFIKVGTNGQRLLNSTGTLLPPGLPEYMQIPSEDAKPEDLTDWYVNRALWRWTRNSKLDNGSGQYSCSQCAGRVTTNAPTRNASVVPAETAPFLPIEDTQCCHGKVSIPADLLDAYQDIPFGTPAWKRSYGRRNPVEKTFSMIKDKGGLQAGWCRSFRSRRPHHRRVDTSPRPQPQTNHRDRKNPNPKTRPSGQAQESPSDPQEHPRRQPHPTGTARLGTQPDPAPTVNPYCRL